MEGLEGAGNDAVMTPESTDVLISAWGTMDPEISPKYPGPTFTKKSQKCRKLRRNRRVTKVGMQQQMEPEKAWICSQQAENMMQESLVALGAIRHQGSGHNLGTLRAKKENVRLLLINLD